MTSSGYDAFYERFDSALMREVRQEAYGEDIGQHSWVTVAELTEDIPRLGLSRASRLLDLDCGPGGPLTFVVGEIGCCAVGLDVSTHAIEFARARATSLNLSTRVDFQAADLNEPLPFEGGSFNAVMSIDTVLHLRDRVAAFKEVARVLVQDGRVLFTDAGVLTGPVANEEIRQRAAYDYTQFCPAGFNERALGLAGLRLSEAFDRTQSLLRSASGRLASRTAHRAELEQVEGEEAFEAQRRYLETVVSMSERGAVSRMAYIAQRQGT